MRIFVSLMKFRHHQRVVSSVGSEHLPYKQGVTGSNPVPPTLYIALYHNKLQPRLPFGSRGIILYLNVVYFR